MSEAERSEPRGLAGWKKPLLVVLATAPIALAVLIFVFMARYEAAFDESRCPYEEVEVRQLRAGLSVREDARVCQPGVEEHRWVVLREGYDPLEVALRPLREEDWEGYSWSAAEEEGRVRVEIRNPGHDPRVFREPPLDSGLRE